MDKTQSAFVDDRKITNNALIGFEMFHYMKKKVRRRKGCMALKVNMAKAYDRIERRFMECVLNHIGFPTNFTKLVIRCDGTRSAY